MDIAERTGSGVYEVELKTRLGDLSGLANSAKVFGKANPGFGLYSENAYLVGSVTTVTGSYISEGSGSYSIKDVATDETLIPFSAYTTMSCEYPGSPYFIQKMNNFYPDRIYKILIKVKYNDGQEQIFDDDFEFKIKR